MLQDTIKKDLEQALKSKDEVSVSTLRLLLAELHNTKIAKRAELTDQDVISQISKEAKKRRESISIYENANRQDLAGKEKSELAVLERYLPKQLDDKEIGVIVDQVIGETGSKTIADMGMVMAKAMVIIAGKAEGSRVNSIVKQKLTA